MTEPLKLKRRWRLSNGRGTILVGWFDDYVEEAVDRVMGWWGPPSQTSVGHIDFIIDGGPTVSLPATDGLPDGWSIEPIEEEK